MIPLRNVPFSFLSLESTQRAESVQGIIFIQVVAASRRELLTLLIHSRFGATILDIALLLSLD